MLKVHPNHPSHKVSAIIQIPKPLQKCKNIQSTSTLHTKKRINTIGYTRNLNQNTCPSEVSLLEGKQEKGMRDSIQDILLKDKFFKQDHENQLWSFRVGNICENVQKYVKMDIQEVSQPEGDLSPSPLMSASQIRQSLTSRISLPYHASCTANLKKLRSSAQLQQKVKPLVLTSRTYSQLASIPTASVPLTQSNLVLQNEILRLQNQKLKQLSHTRKNQVTILLRQILQLKSDISKLFQEGQGGEKQLIQQIQEQSIYFRNLQKSLAISPAQDKQNQFKKIKGYNGVQESRKQTRKVIAKDIYKRLRDVISADIKQNQTISYVTYDQ